MSAAAPGGDLDINSANKVTFGNLYFTEGISGEIVRIIFKAELDQASILLACKEVDTR